MGDKAWAWLDEMTTTPKDSCWMRVEGWNLGRLAGSPMLARIAHPPVTAYLVDLWLKQALDEWSR